MTFGGLLALLAIGSAGSVIGSALPAPDLERGRLVYETNCAICHGLDGNGRGMARHHFETPPADFRTGKFKFRSTPSGSLPLDADLFRTITQGVGRTGMIPQVHLDEADRRDVDAYIKTLSPRFGREEPQPPIPIPSTPDRTPEFMARGRALYFDAGCADCHGEGGKGDGPSARELTDDWGNPIRPADLTRLPRKSGPKPEDLYRTIGTGLDGTPMPSHADALTPEEIWALVAYLWGLPPKSEWANLGTLVDEEIVGFNVEKRHRQPLPPRGSPGPGAPAGSRKR
ncbi:MAG: c-type cytochrome [Candidatus Rokubacteria bacterium]|nr:c-type cytochrome [Candidatus Rokubacteria bacterium]